MANLQPRIPPSGIVIVSPSRLYLVGDGSDELLCLHHRSKRPAPNFLQELLDSQVTKLGHGMAERILSSVYVGASRIVGVFRYNRLRRAADDAVAAAVRGRELPRILGAIGPHSAGAYWPDAAGQR